MERPSLNPSVHLEAAAHAARKPKPTLLRRVASAMYRVVRLGFTPIPLLSRPHEAEEHSIYVRFARGLVYRLAAIPVVLAVIVSTLVYTSTHPLAVPTLADPSSLGLYFEKVAVTSADGVVSEGWVVPVVDARRVLEHKDDVLTVRHPAVVLVHDQMFSRQQLLPYLRPLHDAGIVTITVALRGATTAQPRGKTFGLRESYDVAAAISVLRARPTTDGERMGVIGIGSGATAALLAAKADPRIAVVAAIDPARNASELMDPIGPTQPFLAFLRPVSRFAFETAFDVDAEDADLTRLATALRDRQILYVLSDEQTGPPANHLRTVTHFLETRLSPPTTEASLAP